MSMKKDEENTERLVVKLSPKVKETFTQYAKSVGIAPSVLVRSEIIKIVNKFNDDLERKSKKK